MHQNYMNQRPHKIEPLANNENMKAKKPYPYWVSGHTLLNKGGG